MTPRFVRFILMLSALFFGMPIYGATAPHDPPRQCYARVSNAIDEFAAAEFPKRARDVSVAAFNDIMCNDPESMMNAVVLVRDVHTGELWYGIFHVHSTQNGKFLSAINLRLDKPSWSRFLKQTVRDDGNEWKSDWCPFLQSVYPDDYARQCAPQTPPH